MDKITINKIEPGNLVPISTTDEQYCTRLYDTPYLITNDKTLLFTDSLGPCVSLAVCAKDREGVCHRIVCHCPYAPAVPYHNLEGRIEKYLKSISQIVTLKAMIASFDTFFEGEITDLSYERDTAILSRIKQLFSFWQEAHPDFEIPVIQSRALGVNQNGDFLAMTPEDTYAEFMGHKAAFQDYSTRYNEENLTLSILLERLNKYAPNKEPGTISK